MDQQIIEASPVDAVPTWNSRELAELQLALAGGGIGNCELG